MSASQHAAMAWRGWHEPPGLCLAMLPMLLMACTVLPIVADNAASRSQFHQALHVRSGSQPGPNTASASTLDPATPLPASDHNAGFDTKSRSRQLQQQQQAIMVASTWLVGGQQVLLPAVSPPNLDADPTWAAQNGSSTWLNSGFVIHDLRPRVLQLCGGLGPQPHPCQPLDPLPATAGMQDPGSMCSLPWFLRPAGPTSCPPSSNSSSSQAAGTGVSCGGMVQPIWLPEDSGSGSRLIGHVVMQLLLQPTPQQAGSSSGSRQAGSPPTAAGAVAPPPSPTTPPTPPAPATALATLSLQLSLIMRCDMLLAPPRSASSSGSSISQPMLFGDVTLPQGTGRSFPFSYTVPASLNGSSSSAATPLLLPSLTIAVPLQLPSSGSSSSSTIRMPKVGSSLVCPDLPSVGLSLGFWVQRVEGLVGAAPDPPAPAAAPPPSPSGDATAPSGDYEETTVQRRGGDGEAVEGSSASGAVGTPFRVGASEAVAAAPAVAFSPGSGTSSSSSSYCYPASTRPLYLTSQLQLPASLGVVVQGQAQGLGRVGAAAAAGDDAAGDSGDSTDAEYDDEEVAVSAASPAAASSSPDALPATIRASDAAADVAASEGISLATAPDPASSVPAMEEEQEDAEDVQEEQARQQQSINAGGVRLGSAVSHFSNHSTQVDAQLMPAGSGSSSNYATAAAINATQPGNPYYYASLARPSRYTVVATALLSLPMMASSGSSDGGSGSSNESMAALAASQLVAVGSDADTSSSLTTSPGMRLEVQGYSITAALWVTSSSSWLTACQDTAILQNIMAEQLNVTSSAIAISCRKRQPTAPSISVPASAGCPRPAPPPPPPRPPSPPRAWPPPPGFFPPSKPPPAGTDGSSGAPRESRPTVFMALNVTVRLDGPGSSNGHEAVMAARDALAALPLAPPLQALRMCVEPPGAMAVSSILQIQVAVDPDLGSWTMAAPPDPSSSQQGGPATAAAAAAADSSSTSSSLPLPWLTSSGASEVMLQLVPLPTDSDDSSPPNPQGPLANCSACSIACCNATSAPLPSPQPSSLPPSPRFPSPGLRPSPPPPNTNGSSSGDGVMPVADDHGGGSSCDPPAWAWGVLALACFEGLLLLLLLLAFLMGWWPCSQQPQPSSCGAAPCCVPLCGLGSRSKRSRSRSTSAGDISLNDDESKEPQVRLDLVSQNDSDLTRASNNRHLHQIQILAEQMQDPSQGVPALPEPQAMPPSAPPAPQPDADVDREAATASVADGAAGWSAQQQGLVSVLLSPAAGGAGVASVPPSPSPSGLGSSQHDTISKQQSNRVMPLPQLESATAAAATAQLPANFTDTETVPTAVGAVLLDQDPSQAAQDADPDPAARGMARVPTYSTLPPPPGASPSLTPASTPKHSLHSVTSRGAGGAAAGEEAQESSAGGAGQLRGYGSEGGHVDGAEGDSAQTSTLASDPTLLQPPQQQQQAQQPQPQPLHHDVQMTAEEHLRKLRLLAAASNRAEGSSAPSRRHFYDLAFSPSAIPHGILSPSSSSSRERSLAPTGASVTAAGRSRIAAPLAVAGPAAAARHVGSPPKPSSIPHPHGAGATSPGPSRPPGLTSASSLSPPWDTGAGGGGVGTWARTSSIGRGAWVPPNANAASSASGEAPQRDQPWEHSLRMYPGSSSWAHGRGPAAAAAAAVAASHVAAGSPTAAGIGGGDSGTKTKRVQQ